jgi:hypothetical protein
VIVSSDHVKQLLCLSRVRDVTILEWPSAAARAVQLASMGVPCLLFVEPGTPPPADTDIHDWVWTSADEAEIEARLLGLAKRAAQHPAKPAVEEFGRLTHGRRDVFLSAVDERIARLLVTHFGEVVPETDLLRQVWPDGGTPNALRVHISRLRRAILPLDLAIISVRKAGYVMKDLTRTNDYSRVDAARLEDSTF